MPEGGAWSHARLHEAHAARGPRGAAGLALSEAAAVGVRRGAGDWRGALEALDQRAEAVLRLRVPVHLLRHRASRAALRAPVRGVAGPAVALQFGGAPRLQNIAYKTVINTE